MKKIYVLLFTLLSFALSQAQIIDFPDANFKSTLVNDNVATFSSGVTTDVDANNDGEIQVSEAEAVLTLNIPYKQLSSLIGIEYFSNLRTLICTQNNLMNLDLSSNTELIDVRCDFNDLTALDVTQSLNLQRLICKQNDIAFLDITNNIDLLMLDSFGNPLNATLDTSNNVNLTHLYGGSIDLSNNVNLIELRIGSSGLTSLDMSQAPNLELLYISSSANSTLTQLNLSANVLLESLSVNSHQLSSLDVSNNPNLTYLACSSNQITELDLTNNINLEVLYFGSNQLTSIDLSNNVNLYLLSCHSNQLTDLDISQNVNLEQLYVNDNLFSSLDISNNGLIERFECHNNQLNNLILKNGSTIFSDSYLSFEGNPNLSYICVDDDELEQIQDIADSYGLTDCSVNTYCSFVPGGTFNEVNGYASIDANNNGCDSEDLPYSNLKYNISGNGIIGTVIANDSGDFYLPMENGFYTVTPIIENPSYFSVFPASVDVNFPSDTSPYSQDFCLSVIGASNDLEIVIVPLQQARPGFNIDYRIFYKNNGNTVLSGDVILQYNDDLMDLVSASPFENNQEFGELTWNYSDLQPQEHRSINLLMNINSPVHPDFPVNGDDILDFTATINPTEADDLPEDNTFDFNQTVVNSYDPNDINCLEGDTIVPGKVGDFVHYTIRFENTGSASAVNIVVKDDIDPNFFDISSLIPLTGSHEFFTRINNDTVEFIFENINLPFDNASNDGYLTFKIRTLPTLELGDIFTNTAEIYFDFNAPIITNTASTTVTESLSLEDNDYNSGISMYPNPVHDKLFIKSTKAIESMLLYDLNGRLIQTITINKSVFEKELNVAGLSDGVYFIKIQSQNGEFIQKLIKN